MRTAHVDDMLLSGTGRNDAEVIEVLVEGAQTVHEEVETAGWVLELSKGFTMATSKRLLEKLVKALGSLAGQAVSSVKRLGVDHWWEKGGGRQLPVFTSRLQSG